MQNKERAPHAFANGDVGRITAARIYGVLKAMSVSMIEGGKHAAVYTQHFGRQCDRNEMENESELLILSPEESLCRFNKNTLQCLAYELAKTKQYLSTWRRKIP
jgi:hypothetical protein